MKKLNTGKTKLFTSILFAFIVLIAGIFTTQAFAQGVEGVYMGRDGYKGNENFGIDRGGGHMGRGMMYGNSMGYGLGDNYYMMENLSAENQKKMMNIMNKFFSSTREIKKQSYQKQLELNGEYARNNRDNAKINALKKELANLYSRFEKERVKTMTAMQKLFLENNG